MKIMAIQIRTQQTHGYLGQSDKRPALTPFGITREYLKDERDLHPIITIARKL